MKFRSSGLWFCLIHPPHRPSITYLFSTKINSFPFQLSLISNNNPMTFMALHCVLLYIPRKNEAFLNQTENCRKGLAKNEIGLLCVSFVKFRYCERATKFEISSQLFINLLSALQWLQTKVSIGMGQCNFSGQKHISSFIVLGQWDNKTCSKLSTEEAATLIEIL